MSRWLSWAAVVGWALLGCGNSGAAPGSMGAPMAGTPNDGPSGGGAGSGGNAGADTGGSEAVAEAKPGDVLWTYGLESTQRALTLAATPRGVVAAGDDELPTEGTPWLIELDATGKQLRQAKLDANGPGIWGAGALGDGDLRIAGARQLLSYSVEGEAVPAGGSYVAGLGISATTWVHSIDTGSPTNPYVELAVGADNTLVTGVSEGPVTFRGVPEGEECPTDGNGGYALLLDAQGAALWLKVFCPGKDAPAGAVSTGTPIIHEDGRASFVLSNPPSLAAPGSMVPTGDSLLTFDATGMLVREVPLFTTKPAGTWIARGFAMHDGKVVLLIRAGAPVSIGPLSLPANEEQYGLLFIDSDGTLASGVVLPGNVEDFSIHPAGDVVVAGTAGEGLKYVSRLTADGIEVWRRELGIAVPNSFHTFGALAINVAVDGAGTIYFDVGSTRLSPRQQDYVLKRLGRATFTDLVGAIQP
jgi:hypothetical protein